MGDIRDYVLRTVEEERNFLHVGNRRKANCLNHILRRNHLLKLIIEEKIQGSLKLTGRQRRRRTHILYDVKETEGDWKLEKRTWDRSLCRSLFGRDYGLVTRQITEWSQWPSCLRSLASWDCSFESCRVHRCPSFVSAVGEITLRLADPSFRGALPTLVCHCVCVWWAVAPEEENNYKSSLQ